MVRKDEPWIDMSKIKKSRPYYDDTSSKIHSRKNNFAYTKRNNAKNSQPKNSHHIVVKVTGGDKSINAVKRHMLYDGREGENPIYDMTKLQWILQPKMISYKRL